MFVNNTRLKNSMICDSTYYKSSNTDVLIELRFYIRQVEKVNLRHRVYTSNPVYFNGSFIVTSDYILKMFHMSILYIRLTFKEGAGTFFFFVNFVLNKETLGRSVEVSHSGKLVKIFRRNDKKIRPLRSSQLN